MEEVISDKKDYKNEKYDEVKEAEFPDDTSPLDTEEGVKYINYDRNKKYGAEKEAKCPDDTSLIEMEEGVSDGNDDKNEKLMRRKRQNSQMRLPLLIWRNV